MLLPKVTGQISGMHMLLNNEDPAFACAVHALPYRAAKNALGRASGDATLSLRNPLFSLIKVCPLPSDVTVLVVYQAP
jgi:hypothetical protein